MSFIPFIHFDGTCGEAMTFYADVFGATDLQMIRYCEAPGADPEGPSAHRVLHAQFTAGGAPLMASDYPAGQAHAQSGMSVLRNVPSVAAGEALFEKLLRGGEVVAPFGPTFFAAGFGMLRDRFGTHWMIAVSD